MEKDGEEDLFRVQQNKTPSLIIPERYTQRDIGVDSVPMELNYVSFAFAHPM